MADTRKRTRSQDGTSPLTRLLDQLRRLRVPSIPAEEANALLGPLVLDCLKVCNDSSLADILWNFGWQGNSFTAPVNLFGLSTALSKYRWVRVQELGSGSYAVVYKAKNRETDEIIALKKLRFGFDDQGLPSSTLREISLLKELKHENIVELKDVIFGFGSPSVYVVLECLDCDLRDLLDRDDVAGRGDNLRAAKSVMMQILSAVHHAHMHCVMHRDLKPQNVLVDLSAGRVKVADFGLARAFLPPHKAYTDKVVTLWYRAPELLLGARAYSPAIDLWAAGCIMAELVNREPLFRAESEVGLLHRVFEALGTPTEAEWAGVAQLAHYRTSFPQWRHKGWRALAPRLAGDPAGLDLLAGLLRYDPHRRTTAGQALAHPWFDDVRGPNGGVVPVSLLAPPAVGGSSAGSNSAAARGAAIASAAQGQQQQQQQHTGQDVQQPQHQQQQQKQPQHYAADAAVASSSGAAAGAAHQQLRDQQQQQQLPAVSYHDHRQQHHQQQQPCSAAAPNARSDQSHKLQRLVAGNGGCGPQGPPPYAGGAGPSSSSSGGGGGAAGGMEGWVPQPLPPAGGRLHGVAAPVGAAVVPPPLQRQHPGFVPGPLTGAPVLQPQPPQQQQPQPGPAAPRTGKPPLPPVARAASGSLPPPAASAANA